MRLRAMFALAPIVLAACAGGSDGGTAPSPAGPTGAGVSAQVASYELVAGEDGRLIVGLLTDRNEVIVGGEADFRFFFLGEQSATGREPAGEAAATFLPLPGQEGTTFPERPTPVSPSDARGVYKAEPVSFDRPGFWEVEVELDLPSGRAVATSAFEVVAEPVYPAPGQPAPKTENLTLRSDAPREAIDSRFAIEGKIPDRALHDATIADAIRRGRPVLAVFSTPVYCVSQFCGPITEMVEDLADDYADAAEFVHVEIWRDFQGRVINRGAADWLLRQDDLTEPWVFLVGADGTILARWDNVVAREEVEPWLERLS